MNMVSRSCIKLVELYFSSIDGVEIQKVVLGKVNALIDKELISDRKMVNHFQEIGFEIVEDKDVILTEKIKVAAIELILFGSNSNSIIRNSDYICDKVQEPYDKISKVFSKVTETTLEKYIILLKIEKAKEMVLDGSWNLSEISYQLDYSSVQYLSRQFKQITGYTFSEFKELENPSRVELDKLI